MPARSLATQRLLNQRLIGAPFASPVAAVAGLCAVQAQDYAGAKWALAQRTKSATDSDVERACDAGQIVRTHVLRPTWHFVLPQDLRWLLALSAPRVHALSAYYYRKHELDARTFHKSEAVLARTLAGSQHQTREELGRALTTAGIDAKGERLALILLHAELEALVCSGPRRGKHFTYALVDERLPRGPAPAGADRSGAAFSGEGALAELARRYLHAHGPALVHDFAWWSGLSVGDAKRAFALLGSMLEEREEGGRVYYGLPDTRRAPSAPSPLHLLPNYDEYLIAYKDHGVVVDPDCLERLGARQDVLAVHLLVKNGRAIGGWKRQVARSEARLTLQLLEPLRRADQQALGAVLERYSHFLGMPVHCAAL
jgi:hypothetical protein